MKQEDKQLLLVDLSARLPYGVKCEYHHIQYVENGEMIDIKMYGIVNIDGHIKDICDVKPYLFPLSSMTDEQRKEYEEAITYHDYIKGGWTIAKSFDDEYIIPYWFVDFCNKNHFDYRGLIEEGLAIDCTNLNIY